MAVVHGSHAVSRRLLRRASRKPVCLAALFLAALSLASMRAQTLAIPATGAYTGAYMDFGDTEDTVTLPAIQAFERLVGKHQAIVASSSFWGLGAFPAANAQTINGYGAVPLIYWSPWGPPYEQGRNVDPGKYGLDHIIAGDCDPYIDKWAAAARAFGHPLLVSFACEPNSNWYPWSGRQNGADSPAGDGDYAGPGRYKRAWRHVVDRVRAAGVHNISWVFQANNTSHPERKWNAMGQYYLEAATWTGSR